MYTDYYIMYVYVFIVYVFYRFSGPGLPPPNSHRQWGSLSFREKIFFLFLPVFLFLFSFLFWFEYLLSNYSNSITFFIFEITLTWV